MKRIPIGRSPIPVIQPDQTVKEVMARFPATERVFVQHGLDLCCGGSHPIQMAAQAHGVPLAPLLADLQRVVHEGEPRPSWMKDVADHEVDVREDLRKGSDPFKKIMAVAGEVKPGQVMLVRAIFEPKPLYAVLGTKGFEPFAEQVGEQDWKVYFYKSPTVGTRIPIQAVSTLPSTPGKTHRLDVRGLEPPEPMVKILSTLPDLGPNDVLEVTHFREPVHVYPHLDEAGFTHDLLKESDTLFRLTIKKKG